MSRQTKYVMTVVFIIVVPAVFMGTLFRGRVSLADEQALQTPASFITPISVDAESSIFDAGVLTPITQEVAVSIALEVAAAKGDASPELVSVSAVTLMKAISELSPGMDLPGYDLEKPVFVVKFKGGPFQHARSIPTNRDPSDYITNGVFVVIAVADGDVIGTGALRY